MTSWEILVMHFPLDSNYRWSKNAETKSLIMDSGGHTVLWSWESCLLPLLPTVMENVESKLRLL